MNIYRVLWEETQEEIFVGATNECVKEFMITQYALRKATKTNGVIDGFRFIKIAETELESIKAKEKESKPQLPRGRKKIEHDKVPEFNKDLDADLIKANKLGMSYGQYKNKYYWGA